MKKIIFLAIISVSVFMSGCVLPPQDHPSAESQVVLYEVCNDLALPCKDVYQGDIDRYTEDGPQKTDAWNVEIDGDVLVQMKITKYFEDNLREMDLNNMADGIEGSLAGYHKENIDCSILGSRELDEEFLPTGEGEIIVSCFGN